MLSLGALLKSSDFILSMHGSLWKHLLRRWSSHLLLRRTLWLLYLEQTVGNHVNYRGNGMLEGWDFIGAKSELCERVHRRSWEHKVVVLPQTPLTMPLRKQCGSMATFEWEMHFLYDNTCYDYPGGRRVGYLFCLVHVTWIPWSYFHIYIPWQIFAHFWTGNVVYAQKIMIAAASGSWLLLMLSSGGQICWTDIAALTQPNRRAPVIPFRSDNKCRLFLCNATDHSITNGTHLNALYNIAGGKLQIFQSWEGALCICSLLKRGSAFHKIWSWGLKLSFFVPWNSQVWLYISGQLSSTIFQKLTKPVKRAMIWRQRTIPQFILHPVFASDLSLSLLGEWGSHYRDKRFPNMRTP